MHKRNLAAIWLPWTPTREEPQNAAETENPKEEQKWVMEEEKLKNTPANFHNENAEEKVTRLLFGMDIKKTVL